MALLEILTVPNPILEQVSRPVRDDEFGPELHKFCQDMAETMYAAPGVGLAAAQVGDLRRILVCDVTTDRDDDGVRKIGDLRFMCNPVILEQSRDMYRWEEGCLSVPEFWEYLERPRRVKVRYQDSLGEVHEEWFEDYPSIIVQHEMDHLEGVVILEKVSRFKRNRYLKKVKKWQKQALHAER